MPKIVTAKISQNDLDDIASAKKNQRVRSSLACFSATNGMRPGEFSVIVGKQGNGKSALCKTIGFEASVTGVNSLFILSEEKSSVYKDTIHNAFNIAAKDNCEPFLRRIYFDSMLDWGNKEKQVNFFFAHLEEQINELKIDVVIFDNFTTSFFGQLSVSDQGRAIDSFRLLASEYDIIIVGVFHTVKGTDIYSKIIDGEDVRGNSTSTNSGSYNYILTTYFRADPVRAILFIDKARYHKDANKTYWELFYDKELELYTKAEPTTYNRIMAILKETNNKAKDEIKIRNGGASWSD